MVIKKTSFVLALVISLSLSSFGESSFPLVTDIGFVGKETRKGFDPPDKLMIGLELSRSAYYKFADDKSVIKGGLLKKGLNLIDVKTGDLFTESGVHKYFLDLKAGDLTLRKEIEIDIQVDSAAEEPERQSQVYHNTPGYELSMFVGDRLIVSGQKSSLRELKMNIEKPPLPAGYGPFYEVEKEFKTPLRNSISIIDMAALTYSMIKKLIDKKKMAKTEKVVQIHQQLTATFLRRDSEGAAREVQAVITLRSIRDIS